MHLPFIQVTNEAVDLVAAEVAVQLEADELAILGGLVRMYRWALQRCPDHLPPSASDVVRGPHAAKLIAKAAGYTRDPDAFVLACSEASSPALERVEDGIRIRGLDRYDEAWRKQNKAAVGIGKYQTAPELSGERKQHAKKAAVARWQKPDAQLDAPSMLPACPVDAPSMLENAPQTQMQMHTQKEEEKHVRAEPADPPSPPVQVLALQEAWNAHPELPRWKENPPKRTKRARHALKERDLGSWQGVIDRIASSAFCVGRNDRGWKADPDWMLKPGIATNVLEGKYDGQAAAYQPKPSRPDPDGGILASRRSDQCVECGSIGMGGMEWEDVLARSGPEVWRCYGCSAARMTRSTNGVQEEAR